MWECYVMLLKCIAGGRGGRYMCDEGYSQDDEYAEREGIHAGGEEGGAGADEKATADGDNFPPEVFLTVRLHYGAKEGADVNAGSFVVGCFELAVLEGDGGVPVPAI